MVNVEESEIFGKLLNELDLITTLIHDKHIKNRINEIIEQFDEVIC